MSASFTRISGTGHCEIHGDYAFKGYRAGKVEVGRICPKCLQEGQLKSQAANRRMDEAAAARAHQEKLSRAGIPLAFQGARLSNFKPPTDSAAKVLVTLKNYVLGFQKVLATQPAPGMIFTGQPGTGKTHLGCAMIEELISRGHSATYVSLPWYLTAMSEAKFGKFEVSATTLLSQYARPSLLVADEFGAHSQNDADYQALYNLIDGRYQRNLPTLLITNLTAAQLPNNIDSRLIERIRALSGPLFSFDWGSHRVRSTAGRVGI